MNQIKQVVCVKEHFFRWWIISTAVFATPLSWAQAPFPKEVPAASEAVPVVTLAAPEPEARNRIGISYRMGLNITADFKRLGGVAAPPAPYNGTFQGPVAVISSTPARNTTVVSQAATITGERTLDADVFGFRLGPYLEVPLGEKFSVIISGGLALIAGRTDFSFRETVTIADAGLVTPLRADSGSQTDFLVGGYIGGSLSYALTKQVSVISGVQFQAAGRAVNRQAGKVSILNLGESVIVSVGATDAF